MNRNSNPSIQRVIDRLRRFTIPRALVSCAGAAITLALLALMAGCGVSGVTDGGVPVGPTRAALSGKVVSAVDPTHAIAGANLVLVDSEGAVYSGVTSSDGSYTFGDVTLGTGALTVAPPASSGLAPQTLAVNVAEDSLKAIAATVAPAAVYSAATGLHLSMSTLDVNLGAEGQINATITGAGVPAGTQPSLVVFGGIGQVFTGGRFVATHPGVGKVVVTFGEYSQSIQVTVH